MKLITIFLIICTNYGFVTAHVGNTKSSFVLYGKTEKRASGIIYIDYIDKNDIRVIDSCKIEKGSFQFAGLINEATSSTIYEKDTISKSKKINVISFYLEPAIIKIRINKTGFTVKGSNTQAHDDILTNLKKPIYKSLDSIVKELDETNIMLKTGDQSNTLINKQKSLQEKRANLKEKEKAIDYRFLMANPKSYLNPQILSYYFGTKKLSLDSTMIMFGRFDKEVQNSRKGKILQQEIQGRKNSSTGQMAPLFVKKDINGEEINLALFRDRNYVLLDFWASWCIPCRKFTPTMKSYYQKYHSKGLEIISISWDSDAKAWKDAIQNDGMYLWKHILANMYLPNDNSMRDKYSIPSIPMLILIDKKGIIVGRFMAPKEDGGQAELEKELDKIFNN